MQAGDRAETIAAIATAEGPAGVAVVRISGPESWKVAGRVVRGGRSRLEERAGGCFFHAQVADPVSGVQVDDGVVLLFRGPASFTGEDVVEIQGHGGAMLPRAVLRAVLSAGARLAEPGEFTRRAFLNGRMDLSQAEAVMDLVRARSERAARAARAQLAGELSQAVNGCYERVTALRADVEAQLDFEAGELPLRVREETVAMLDAVREHLARLLATSREGQLLRDGALVVIGGCPNAGKSSLMNALLGKDRAIVSSMAGTTRDTIEEGMNLDGIPLRLVDTAGLRKATCPIEQEGVLRAQQSMEQADLVIYLIDAARSLSEQRPEFGPGPAQLLLVLNKTDLPARVGRAEVARALEAARGMPGPEVLLLSLKTGTGLTELKAELVKQLGLEIHGPAQASVSERHRIELLLSDRSLVQAREYLCGDDAQLVLAAGELRRAAEALGRITGRIHSHDLLDQIFLRFCVGK